MGDHTSLPNFPNIHRSFMNKNPKNFTEMPKLLEKSSNENVKSMNKISAKIPVKNSSIANTIQSSDNSMVKNSSISEFPYTDKYQLIMENNRALKREIKDMDTELDLKEMELENDIRMLNSK